VYSQLYSDQQINKKLWSITFINRIKLVFPSFSLLYSLDEISNPELTLKILGHQWYWSYEIADFNSCSDTQNLKYSSYMLTNEALTENSSMGFFRDLETNKRIVLSTYQKKIIKNILVIL